MYDHVLVEPILALEGGKFGSVYMAHLDTTLPLCGTLHCVLGDDIGQRKIQVCTSCVTESLTDHFSAKKVPMQAIVQGFLIMTQESSQPSFLGKQKN